MKLPFISILPTKLDYSIYSAYIIIVQSNKVTNLYHVTDKNLYLLRVLMAFPREKRENEEFDDEEFLTRKTDEKNEELTSLKIGKNQAI